MPVDALVDAITSPSARDRRLVWRCQRSQNLGHRDIYLRCRTTRRASLSRADLVRVGGWCWQPRDRRPSSAKRYRFVVRPSSTFRASDIVATPVATARNSSGSKPLIVTGRLCWPT
jgi:hypothetical protein